MLNINTGNCVTTKNLNKHYKPMHEEKLFLWRDSDVMISRILCKDNSFTKKDKLSFSIYLNESSCMKQLLGKGRAVKITKLFYGLQDLQQDTHISMRIASRVHWQ